MVLSAGICGSECGKQVKYVVLSAGICGSEYGNKQMYRKVTPNFEFSTGKYVVLSAGYVVLSAGSRSNMWF